ncbi:MAG: UDP-N-acetylmuramoyl-L-alanine--D-glutamate ligase [Patescibacteria group bacterium]|nr:UDP-N-acetylmuramoyl-L-alanine--D-glutamate ligase [Patescibacteria group bacterium]
MLIARQKLNKLQNKKICMLGFGIENQALIRFLLDKKINCEITICDAQKNKNFAGTRHGAFPQNKNINWQLGKNYDANLDKFDIIFRVAGYPLFSSKIKKAKMVGVEISSPTKLFFELCPTKNIIGVTGAKGKGTTASLIYHILKKAGKRIWIGGNIGIAPFEFINKIKKNDWVVLELSSFQLEDMAVSPHIAVITNFYKEHLAPADPNNPNYHRSLADYWNAKMNIVKWQKKGDEAVVNKNLELRIKNLELRTKKYFFSNANKDADCYFIDNNVIKIQNSKFKIQNFLIGEHNKENVAAAVEAAKLIGVTNKIIKKAIAEFKGLEHRIEHVKNVNGVKYYNDSFATTPESAITALESFNGPIILLAGGADKGSSFKQFAKEIKKRVKFVILLNGKATPRIKEELLKIKYPKNNIKLVNSIKSAVKTARENADKGYVVLLSPACASFGMFKNYKERGIMFKQEVKEH